MKCLISAANIALSFALVSIVGTGCSHPLTVKSEAYAKLSDHRTFEYDFPLVWKGIEGSLKNHKITDRDPKEVDELEMRKLNHRTLETDWVYSQSRDKYVEYKANGSPRRINLQTRLKYQIDARKTLAGADVLVKVREEIENLKPDGS